MISWLKQWIEVFHFHTKTDAYDFMFDVHVQRFGAIVMFTLLILALVFL